MTADMRFVAPFFFLLCGLTCAYGAVTTIQLPPNVVSHMSGEWGVEVHSPCKPLISSGTLSFDNGTVAVRWTSETLSGGGPLVEPAPEGADVFDASGLALFFGATRARKPILYTVCKRQENTIDTPDRPGFEERMKSTELVEYTGLLLGEEKAESECQSSSPNVFVRTIGSDVRGLKETHWKRRESLQYVEAQFSVRDLVGHCVESDEGRATPEEPAEKTGAKSGRRRRRRAGFIAGRMDPELEGVTDQRAREGCIIIRLARRTLPVKSFYERYFPTLLFVGLMVMYRAIYAFTSYRTRRK